MRDKKYTVLLLAPTHVSAFDGETYLVWVLAPNPEVAIIFAQLEATAEPDYEECAPDTFPCLLIISGHHKDLRA